MTNGTTDAASRKQITVNKCAPASWDGHVTLLWEGGVKVYTAASDGVEVASGTTFANEHLPTNFWVEGTAPSTTAGDVVFRLNPVEVSCPNAEEGCDRATMTVVRVDVDVDGLAESAEETVPGGVVCVTNHPNRAVSRKMITVQRAEPTDWDGEVMLDWSAGNVKMYTAASNGVEVAAGTSFANAALPTNLWVEGTAASATAGDVILKVTPVGVTCNHADTGCDWARMTMILVDVDVEGLADPVEEDAPGAFVCVTNGPGQTVTRKQITVQQVEPTDWDGEVKLDWSAGKIKVYTASNNGVEVTSGNTFANAALPTNFWVEGTAPSASAGDVIFRFNPVGASCPHVATGCDRVVMTILKVDMVTPAGDPTNTPVASGVGQNEFTFSTNTPGVLEMNLKAEVSPSGVAAQIKDQCLFSVDAIAGSTLAWDAANPGGKPTASNDFLLATVRFSGLPSANSALGAKKAAVFYNSAKCDEESYEVFFPKNAANHPGGQAGSPNWYFYWSQTTANGANTTMVYTNGTRSYYDYFAGRTIFIEDDAALSQIAAWGTPRGIDCFAWTTAHEAKHHTQLTGFWPTNWIAAQDIDSDWLPNNQETNYMPGRAYSPTNAATFPDSIGYGQNPIPDVEDINMRSQTSPYNLDQLWSNGTANAEDWADPGKNSATSY